jgi:hypothetical protein
MSAKKSPHLYQLRKQQNNLLQWMIVSLLLALTLCMIFAYLWMALTKEAPITRDYGVSCKKLSLGRTFNQAVALLGEGVGDMFKRTRNKILNLAIGGLCLIPLFISSFYAAFRHLPLHIPSFDSGFNITDIVRFFVYSCF